MVSMNVFRKIDENCHCKVLYRLHRRRGFSFPGDLTFRTRLGDFAKAIPIAIIPATKDIE